MWHTWTCPPVNSASSASRAIMASSASPGMPGSPRRVATAPSFMWPWGFSVRSSSWPRMGRPSVRAYSRAWRIRPPCWTGLPSSENATAPPSAMSAISASSSPRRPFETVPMGYTSTASPSARFLTNSTTSRVAMGGSVLGMQATAVNPPQAAARAPVWMVSLCSWPGSRKWTCMSIQPWLMVFPVASQTRTPSGGSTCSASASIRPSRMSRSARRDSPVRASRTVPPEINRSRAIGCGGGRPEASERRRRRGPGPGRRVDARMTPDAPPLPHSAPARAGGLPRRPAAAGRGRADAGVRPGGVLRGPLQRHGRAGDPAHAARRRSASRASGRSWTTARCSSCRPSAAV